MKEKALTAETVKEFLSRIQPYTSSEYHTALSEALTQVEAETNSTVSMDASSDGYKKFAAKVQACRFFIYDKYETLKTCKQELEP